MNVLSVCTGCDSGRCLVQPTREPSEKKHQEPGAGWAFRPGKNPFARVESLSERVWLVVEDDRFNEHPFMYLVVTQSRVVCIDTGVGTANYGQWLSGWLERHLGPQVASRPILVINTHCHYDHVGGNAGLAPPRSEAIAASNHDPEFTRAAFDAVRDASLAREVGCHELAQYTVTRWLADGEVIPLGDNADEGSLRVIHVPGHTPDSLALWLLPERICFVGDSLYPHASVIVSNRDSSLAQYVASLQVLESFLREQQAAEPEPLEATVSSRTRQRAGEEQQARDEQQRPQQAEIRLACGHVDAELPPEALTEMLALVTDVSAGRERAARPPSRSGWESVLFFERGRLCLTVRTDDPALPPQPPAAPVAVGPTPDTAT